MKAANLLLLVVAVLAVFAAEAAAVPLWLAKLAACLACVGLCAALYAHTATALCALALVAAVAAARTGTLGLPTKPDGGAEAMYRCTVDLPAARRCRDAGRWCTYETQVSLVARAHCGNWEPAKGRVRLALWDLGGPVARGDRILVRLIVDPAPVVAEPWHARPEAVARARGAWNCAHVRGVHVIEQPALGCLARLDRLRSFLAAQLDCALPLEQAAVARALTLGDQAGLTVEQRDRWAEAGLAHLLAISGLHVSLIARMALSCALGCVGLLRSGQRWHWVAHVVAVTAVWGYALMAGLPVAATRAACMASVALIAPMVGRGPSAVQVLGATGLLLVGWNPLAALSPGFLLSFVSVACLLAVPAQALRHTLPGPSLLARLGALWRSLRLCMLTSLAATLGTAPLAVLFFHQFAWVGPLANVVAIPLGALLITPWALLTVALTPWSAVYVPATQLLGLALVILERWAGLCAKLGGGAWHVMSWLVSDVVAWAALVTALWLRMSRPQYRRSCFILLALGTGCLACGAGQRWYVTGQDGRLTLYHLDVGQGDATLVRADNGSYVLIDGGGALHAGQSDPGRQAVAPALRHLQVRRLDGVLITHAHPDHMAGLHYVLERWPCRQLWRSEHAAESAAVQRLERLVKSRGGQVLTPPRVVYLGRTAFTFFAPLAAEQASANDHSTVVQVQLGARAALLLADIEQRAEAWLAQRAGQVDYIKVAHHGSKTSSSDLLLRTLAPAAAVISCGRRNRFGFPHPEVTARLAAQHVKVYRTDLTGCIEFSTEGLAWTVRTAQDAGSVLPLAMP